MNKALPISRLIKVDVNLAPNAAQSQDISTLLILGNSGIIDNVEKIRRYDSIDAVAFDFGTTTPEYKAAVLWFEQSPQPALLLVGNWRLNASPAKLVGAPLTAQQQLLSNFTAITNGYAGVDVNGVQVPLLNMNFSSATNLNAVAQILETKSNNAFTCVFDFITSKFIVSAKSSGALSTISFFKVPLPIAELKIFTPPVAGFNILNINTSVLKFGATASANIIAVGVTAIESAANILAFLQSPVAGTGSDRLTDIAKATYALSETDPTVIIATLLNTTTAYLFQTVGDYGLGGTGYPITGQNTYGLFGNTVTNSGAYLVQGADSQTPLEAVVDYDNNFGQTFYGLTVLELESRDNATIDIANFIEAANNKHIFAVSTTKAGSIVAATTTDIGSRLKALNLKRTLCQYSSSNPYAAVSLLARILTTNYNANNTVITLMYKQEPGIVAEQLSATEIGALEAKNINVFVAYNNNTAIVEQGKMSNGYFIDEVTGTDWLALAIQTEIFNALYTSTTKIPQTDSGVHTLLTVTEGVCSQGVVNGLLAPGVWNTQGFGSLNQGDYLPKGFYVYAASVNTQLSADRAARKSPPIQVAAKLAGAIHTVDVIINVNR